MDTTFKTIIVTQAQYASVAKQMSSASLAARIACAQELVRQSVALGYTLVMLVDKETGYNFEGLGATLFDDSMQIESKGFGINRRYIFKHAASILAAHSGPGAVVWTEPEKVDFIRSVAAVISPIKNGDADIVLPRRNTLTSYPTWQQPWEETGNSMCSKIFGQSFDFFFGPKACNLKALQYFIEYPGQHEVADKWDSIFSPLLDAQADGMRFAEVVIDFTYPEIQRNEEENDLAILPRRTHGQDIIVGEFYNRKIYLEKK